MGIIDFNIFRETFEIIKNKCIDILGIKKDLERTYIYGCKEKLAIESIDDNGINLIYAEVPKHSDDHDYYPNEMFVSWEDFNGFKGEQI